MAQLFWAEQVQLLQENQQLRAAAARADSEEHERRRQAAELEKAKAEIERCGDVPHAQISMCFCVIIAYLPISSLHGVLLCSPAPPSHVQVEESPRRAQNDTVSNRRATPPAASVTGMP